MAKKDNKPLTYSIAYWYAFVFAGVFLLYGGVQIILNILDRNYQDMAQPILFAALGVILISVAYAFRGHKSWGWYGLVVINILIIIDAAVGIRQYENIILLVFSGVALYALFAPATKEYMFGRRQ